MTLLSRRVIESYSACDNFTCFATLMKKKEKIKKIKKKITPGSLSDYFRVGIF